MSGNHADININYALEKFGAIWGGIPVCRDNCCWLGELLASVPSSLVVGTMMYVDRGYDVPLCLAGCL